MMNVNSPDSSKSLFFESKYECVMRSTSGMLIERQAFVKMEMLSRFWKKDRSAPQSNPRRLRSDTVGSRISLSGTSLLKSLQRICS